MKSRWRCWNWIRRNIFIFFLLKIHRKWLIRERVCVRIGAVSQWNAFKHYHMAHIIISTSSPRFLFRCGCVWRDAQIVATRNSFRTERRQMARSITFLGLCYFSFFYNSQMKCLVLSWNQICRFELFPNGNKLHLTSAAVTWHLRNENKNNKCMDVPRG